MLNEFSVKNCGVWSGADLSLNHSAVYVIDWHIGIDDLLVTMEIRNTKNKDKVGILTKKQYKNKIEYWHMVGKVLKVKHRDDYEMKRLRMWYEIFGTMLHSIAVRNTLNISAMAGAVEGYAFAAQSSSRYQIGEMIGLYKVLNMDSGTPVRVHAPTSVKLYATGNGRAHTEEIAATHKQMFDGLSMSMLSMLDAVVAYELAKMMRDEIWVRQGTITQKQLKPEQIRVFNNVTKKNPVNLLSRDFTV